LFIIELWMRWNGLDERRTFANLDGSIKVKRVEGAP
jgi:hypothetical protein